MPKIKFFILVTFSILSFYSVTLASHTYANDSPRGEYETVNPNDGLKYGMKRLKEKIVVILLSVSSTRRANFYHQMLNTRLTELKYVVDNKDEDSFEVATKRYFSTAGQYAEFLKNKNLENKKAKAIETFNNHKPILEKLRDTFDPQTAQWRFLQDDINYLQQYTQLLVP